MRRIGRYILCIVTIVSTLLCLVSAFLWVRQRPYHSDCLQVQIRAERNPPSVAPAVAEMLREKFGYKEVFRIERYLVGADSGDFFVAHDFRPAPESRLGLRYLDESPSLEARLTSGSVRSIAGAKFTAYAFGAHRYRGVSVPLWWVTILTALLPALYIMRFALRRRRLAGGSCLKCGYDLRATPDRCPECGTVLEKSE